MKKRIVIDVNGEPRTVCSIKENQNNFDLNIHITSGAKYYRGKSYYDLISGGSIADYAEVDKYITAHCSPNSKQNNMIKRTIKFPHATEQVDTLVQVTGAVKSLNSFTPVIFRVCGHLEQKRFKLSENCNDKLVNLGSYNPNTDQLRFMLVLSDSSLKFPCHKEHPSNAIELNFTNFNVTMIYSFLNVPSPNHSIDYFLSTSRASGPIRGLSWGEIYDSYTDLNMTHACKHFEIFGSR